MLQSGGGSGKFSLKACRRKAAKGRMGADGIVKGFEIGKDIVLGSCPCRVVLEVDPLTLEAAEEVLRNGIVIGIAAAGHTLPDAIPGRPGRHTGRPSRCEKSDLGRVYADDTPYPVLPAPAGYRFCPRRHNRRSCVYTGL